MSSGTVELFKWHFDIALETKDGVKKLRDLILTLAMQGKLVKQDEKHVNLEFVQSLGADTVIDYTKDNGIESGTRYDEESVFNI